MVNCDTALMNGENVAVRPNRSVAVTVYLMVRTGLSAGTFHAPVHISEGCREYSDVGNPPTPRHRMGTSIVLPANVRWAVRTAVFSTSPEPPSIAVILMPTRWPRLKRLVRIQCVGAVA